MTAMHFQADALQTTFAILLSTLLATALFAQEFRRASRRRLWLRLALSLVAASSLLIIGLEPTRPSPSRKKVALLSDSLSPRFVDSLSRLGEFEMFSLCDGNRVERVQDAGFVARNFPTSEIRIFGNGLNKADLTRLRGRKAIFQESELPTGVAELRAPQSIRLGEIALATGLVRGEFQRLVFKVDGVAMDSLASLRGETRFEFSFAPKRLGKHRLSLDLDGREESFGLVVSPIEPLSILVLESEPRFETKHLKNVLAEKAYRVAWRAAIGKERFREEFLNLPKQPLRPLSRKSLARFDLAMMDATTLRALSPSEQVALQNAVAEEGLGVFVADADSAFWQDRALRFFHCFRLRPRVARDDALFWAGAPSPLISLEPYAIEETLGVQALARDSKGDAVVAFAQKGLGRVGISLVQNAFRWRLEGHRDVYASYWARLLSALAKPSTQTTFELPTLAFAGEPMEIALQTAVASPSLFVREDSLAIPIPLRQEPLRESRYVGRFWAKASGWIELVANGRDTTWAFVSDESAFEAMRKETRRKETAEFVKTNVVAPIGAEDATKRERDLPLMLWLFIAFALAMGGLWLEAKA